MPSEQRKNYIKDNFMALAQQTAYWHEKYMGEDHDGALEESYNQKFRYYADQYMNLIAEYFDFDWEKASPYTAWNQVENCKKFLIEN